MKIFMFRTNCKVSDKKIIGEILNQYKGIKKWDINLENKNKVLRVEGWGVTAQKIITSIKASGFKCKDFIE